MNCTRVLHMLDTRPMPGPIMPVDVAMRICLASSPPLRSFFSTYEDCQSRNLANCYKPLRPCISSKQEAEASSLGWKSPKASGKKRVVFADSKGMSLTAIHVFKEFEEDPLSDLQFDLSDLANATTGRKVSIEKSFTLDFPQPAADYLDFRNRLKKNQVCLENCTLQERSLTGTVKVRNVSFEKLVSIRITFDSWETHTDVACTYLNNVYGCLDTDTFAFTIDLPSSVPSQERVEFCICFTTQDQTYWDNNDEKNYKLLHNDTDADQTSNPIIQITAPVEFKRDGNTPEMEFDQFGSPRTSSGFFPEWQSRGRIETTAPYW
ncbi:protein phosphatase 1 regulatory subunit 3C-B [Oncorhynchus tshawytscha]|nr:protein phosphatase 1 regulatory subunit 3C-B [Oncorhynchus tshawytscha]